jgi:hypothetical protein
MAYMLTACAGIVLIAVIVWEVFQDLFRPGDSGALSDWIGRRLFNVLRRRPRFLSLAGPLAVVAVIGTWVLLLVLGFALLYYGPFPEEFRTSTGDTPAASPRLFAAFYYSFETLITLGYGDLVPDSALTRIASVAEGLIGFGVLTASVSMLVLIYPALARMRVLARTVSNIAGAEQRTGMSMVGSGSDVMVAALARDVIRMRIDLVHFPIIYYFATHDRYASVAYWIFQVGEWARQGLAPDAPAHVRVAAGVLDRALDDFATLLLDRFVPMQPGNRQAVFHAFAADHRIDLT